MRNKIRIFALLIFMFLLTSCSKSNISNNFKTGLYKGNNDNVFVEGLFDVDLTYKIRVTDNDFVDDFEGTYNYYDGRLSIKNGKEYINAKYDNSTIYISFVVNSASYDLELTCFKKYIGSYKKHVSAMNSDINYNIEFYLYNDSTYKTITTYKAMGKKEAYEENGIINLNELYIKPNGLEKITEGIEIVYNDEDVVEMTLSIKTSNRSKERYLIKLTMIGGN